MASAQENAVAELAALTALQTLQDSPTNERIVRMMAAIYKGLDRAIDGARQEGEGKPVCRAGCNYCCHYVVVGSMPEVAVLAETIRSSVSAPQRDRILQRLNAYQRVVAPRFGKNLAQVRTPCPFLEDGLCLVYEARPFRCRGMNSLDVTACERRLLDSASLTPLPMAQGQNELARAASDGLKSALLQLRIFGYDLDVARAVAIALEESNAVSMHLQGEQTFMPALVRPEPSRPIHGDAAFRTYEAGEEPTGRIVIDPLREHLSLSNRGHTEKALKLLDFDHPAKLFRRLLVPPFYSSEEEIDEWRARFETTLDKLAAASFDPREAFDAIEVLQVFELAYCQRDDLRTMSRLGDIVVGKITSRALPDLAEPIEPRPRSGRLKVGYISCNLSNSNGGSWSLGWIRNHSAEIETYALFLGDSADDVTLEFREAADHFFHMTETAPINARFIKSLGLDVLIYPDIGLAGRNYQYASMRLAPRQGTAWGHPVTSGLPTIDFYLSSAMMEPPDGQSFYREKLALLPNSGLCYRKKRTPVSRLERVDFGLDEGPLLLSCQNPMKLHPHWDFLYREINELTGRPVVFLEGPGKDVGVLKSRMAKAGITAKWIPGLSDADFLGLLNLADVCLDTPGWNGGNTTIQALTLGKPVVSMAGATMRSRHCLAFLPTAGVPGLVAGSPREYVNLVADAHIRNAAMRNLDAEALYGDVECVEALDRFLLSD